MSMPMAVSELLNEWKIESPTLYKEFLKICGLSEDKREVNEK